MKDSSKLVVAGAALAGLLAVLKSKAKKVAGIGAVHMQITGKILKVEYRNTSLYGNNSYWVYMDTDRGFVKAYTAANSQLGYLIDSLEGREVTFEATRRKDGGIVLHHTIGKYWDWQH